MKKMRSAVRVLTMLIGGSLCLTCERVKTPLEVTLSLVRPAIKLSAEQIPILNGTKEMRGNQPPRLSEVGWSSGEQFFVVKFVYTFEKSPEDVVSLDLIVTKDESLARRYVDMTRKTSSIPLQLLEPPDNPPVAGEISFGGGREFIRDNIIISMFPRGEFEQQKGILARQIDSLLLKTSATISAEKMKPVIHRFAIAENPVQYRSVTRLYISVSNPAGGKYFYHWRFHPGNEHFGGIEIDDAGHYYYYAETGNPIQELILVVVNESGFYASATIKIRVLGLASSSGLKPQKILCSPSSSPF